MAQKENSGGIADTSISALMHQVDAGQEAMQLWSDEKKADFARIFTQRTEAARYILLATARLVIETAARRKFVSQRKINEIYPQGPAYGWNFGCFVTERGYGVQNVIGGRTPAELEEVAVERAKKIIDEMPLMRDAVKVIAPDIAKKIEKVDKLRAEGQKILEQLDEYAEPVHLSDHEEKKVVDFLAMLKERSKARRKLVSKLDEIGEEGLALEASVDKALYRGLPGLDTALLEIVKDHIERAKALVQFSRRVEEKVKFGDSAAATDLLHQFERDEAEISEKIKGQFQGALDKLKLFAKGGKTLRQLQSKEK